MNEIVLDDSGIRENLFPFARTRSAADIRIGILSIREKWEQLFRYKVLTGPGSSGIPAISSNIIPDDHLVGLLKKNSGPIRLDEVPSRVIQYPWHIVQYNDEMIRKDFAAITRGRKSAALPAGNQSIGTENIFIEPGAKIMHASLNASTGPIYIGKNAEVMEGALIRGPFALCESAVLKMGAKVYGATTIGPHCVAGGEIRNSVMFGYSNKSHDGYLGDSVIGEWCNIGAGTSNSNIKNTASGVKVWNEASKQFLPAGIKCGLFMGDYSRCAINTSFNTGAVVGVACNVFGNGLTPRFIPDFSWGFDPLSVYRFDKAIRDIGNWKKLKHQSLDEAEISILKHIFEQNHKPSE